MDTDKQREAIQALREARHLMPGNLDHLSPRMRNAFWHELLESVDDVLASFPAPEGGDQ